MSNFGKWNDWYAEVTSPFAYGETPTYQMGADFLADCDQIEDWGCGAGWLSTLVSPDRYIGVDGSWSRFAQKQVDLETYTSDVDGIFMRHILEHNYKWQQILENAMKSFRRKFVLITFTPFTNETQEIAFNEGLSVPDLAFSKEDLTNYFKQCEYIEQTLESDTQYGTETIFMVTKNV